MDNHQTPNKTPSNFLESLPKDIRDAVNKKNQIHNSPFTCLPHHTTPPSRYFAIKNPFEAVMNEHIHKHIFSPSVFQEVKKSRGSERFKWTIEDISSLTPANIDVTSTSQFEQVNSNAEDDVHVQEKIEKYFSETHIVPSPWNEDVGHQAPLLPETESPIIAKNNNSQEDKKMCNVWTQTILSLPPNLPKEVEAALKPYFNFVEDQRRQSVDLNSTLCRRLFNFTSPVSSEEECNFSHEELSVIGSPIITQASQSHKRNFDSSSQTGDLIPIDISPIHNSTSTPNKLNPCHISPISPVNLEHEQLRSAVHEDPENSSDELSPIELRKSFGGYSFAKMDFSGHMSVDTSFNLAPENDCIGVGNETNLSESPVRTNEFMENCNWDIEYNNISSIDRPIRRSLFDPKRNNTERMDISNHLTTPKSKIINSQRKKLSDSFKLGESFSDDELLNFNYVEVGQIKKRLNCCDKYEEEADHNLILSQNTQDTGYNTCIEGNSKSNNSKDEEMIVSDIFDYSQVAEKENKNQNFYASTPSKRYFSKLDDK